MGFPPDQGGIGLGVALTSLIFLTAILATVIWLTVTRRDVIGAREADSPQRRSWWPIRAGSA